MAKVKKSSVILTCLLLALLCGVLFYIEGNASKYIIRITRLCAINIVLALSMNLVNGFTGIFSLGHAGFMAIGAYSVALLTIPVAKKETIFMLEPLIAPLNVISEVATPLSMTFRHYGNVLSGVIIEMMIGSALGSLSNIILGWLPGVLGKFPLLEIGIPAILSVYFDIFSGCLQAYIFAMLTMLYISNGFPAEDYKKKLAGESKKSKKAVTARD